MHPDPDEHDMFADIHPVSTITLRPHDRQPISHTAVTVIGWNALYYTCLYVLCAAPGDDSAGPVTSSAERARDEGPTEDAEGNGASRGLVLSGKGGM